MNAFRAFWELGYRLLVPIVPPDATLSPTSSLAKRAGMDSDGRGKSPGFKGEDGLWRGFDWLKHETTIIDINRWHAMGAGVGIRTGKQPDGTWLLAIDADTLDEKAAAMFDADLAAMPKRVGRPPKALYPVRCMEPFKYTRLEFGDGERVEILSDGRQFVAHGVHPVTRKPYVWPRTLVPFDQLPIVTPEDLL